MIGLLQRVTGAAVVVAGETIAAIDAGLLVLVAVQSPDQVIQAERLLDRLLGYRVFADDTGRMNRSLTDTGGGLLLVPQFTLAADTRSGTRAGFSAAAPPEQAERLFAALCESARARHPRVASGRFGDNMQVSLINDGPVTFWIEAN